MTRGDTLLNGAELDILINVTCFDLQEQSTRYTNNISKFVLLHARIRGSGPLP